MTQRPPAKKALFKSIPAVDRVLSSTAFRSVRRGFGARLATDLLREELDRVREAVRGGELDATGLRRAVTPAALARRVGARATALLAPRPRAVINATGIVVHTNLGRAPLSREAAEHLARTASGYVDLEYDVEAGTRGRRSSHVAPLMGRLFPGHDFVVLNNNAAAILICLQALAKGKEVLISRGELVEIGGSFRVPDILAASGAKLREVGTTNRTRKSDYAKAVGPKTGLILKVHTSNFKIVGFTEETAVAELAAVARKAERPLVVDWGSGDLVDLAPLGIHDETPVQKILEAGADLVTFSGDKLLGGPQAGFVVGRPELIAKLKRHPLARVCRLDRLLTGVLQRTLAAYVAGRAEDELPVLRMLGLSPESIGKRASKLKRALSSSVGKRVRLSLIDGVSRTGGGSSPTGERPTRLLSIELPSGDAGRLERKLREADPPVVGRLHDGALLLDLRTVNADDEETLAERLIEAIEAVTKRD
ncbi:MAG: L-seryl-tRNA(Sec) selenium transferase [bacterium]|nr:L-seryl-tRNA(Sec) selenium transferase [bacterium]